VPVEGSVRERRRAETMREIKDAALAQLAESGAAAVSLRGVARAIGMTVQSLYHYFDSRDALLTALMTDAHHALADAVQAAAEETEGRPPLDRRLAATGAFRNWALVNRSAFLLLFGTPVAGFELRPEAGPGEASLRLAAPFLDVVFDGWTPEQLAALPLPPGGEQLAAAAHPGIPLPPGALALFIELRGRMHGLVLLELIGHLDPFNEQAEALFHSAMHRMSQDVDAAQPARE
jgi:AcrR family transcriptional regulator